MDTNNVKKCIKCGEIKALAKQFFEFRVDTQKFRNICRECSNELSLNKKKKYRASSQGQITQKKYYQTNKNHILQQQKNYYNNNLLKRREILKQNSSQYRIKNPDKIKNDNKIYYQKNQEQEKLRSKQWKINNPDKIRQHKQKRRQNSFNRLMDNISTQVWKMLKTQNASKCTLTRHVYLKYTSTKLRRHIESQFKNNLDENSQIWMTWDNYGKQWDLDHIIPKNYFNCISPTDLDFKICWDLQNLRPLEKIKNIQKNNKILIENIDISKTILQELWIKYFFENLEEIIKFSQASGHERHQY